MKNFLLPGLLFLIMLLAGCAQQTYLQNNTKLSSAPCDSNFNGIYLFFAGEPVDFAYEKIAFIEEKGQQYPDDSTGLEFMKYDALKLCANVVIHVSKDLAPAYAGSFGRVLNNPVWRGLAVRVKVDEAFIAKYGKGYPLDFSKAVELKKKNDHGDRFAWMVGLLSFAIFGAYLLIEYHH